MAMEWDKGEGTICLHYIPGRGPSWMPELRGNHTAAGIIYEIHDVVQGDGDRRLPDYKTWIVAASRDREALKAWGIEFYKNYPNATKEGTYPLPGGSAAYRHVTPIKILPKEQQILLLC